ncbi:MAG: acyl carrier protein [Nitrosospira sp.]|jgi:acyl carrier protein|nr:acyl carrier protein [Nitrosospira sp.]MDW7642318.1 phosphopantetheine-binding protein [Nitrosomonadaceae bacterium]MBI0414274.1 acyl carrier protein [Nitrosospira sp.]MBI0417326.1 acyl carrier protein [Nitrosospira sp.]MBI0418483.1 acyl carrier protein [Nitrosospira sp.]
MTSFDYIRQVLIDKYEIEADVITSEATFENLGLDSLTMVELMFDVSEKYGIEIPTDRLDFKTLGEVVVLIDDMLNAQNI